uniref:Uncharacterized protein n=1 Tax=Physcomitrium patens TaxID=3218 RepID=A0A2K1K1V7_PHYPA|nr:hypothetical protein PHYPA_012229 [Physcomitrium patens]
MLASTPLHQSSSYVIISFPPISSSLASLLYQLNITFLVYLLTITIILCMLAFLEVKWFGITLEKWWKNEQFYIIGGTNAHLATIF